MNFLRSLSFMRALRLIFGLAAIIQGIVTKDLTLGLLGLVVGGMSFFNIGCCGTNGCGTDHKNNTKKNNIEDVSFEEVVSK